MVVAKGNADPANTRDRDLVDAASGGDAGAFGLLLLRHGPPLQRHLYRLVEDSHLAEDLYQETCLRAWLHLDGLSNDDAFVPWLYRIALNEARMAWRRPGQTIVSLDSLDAASTWVPPQLHAMDASTAVVDQDALFDAISTLSPAVREVMVLTVRDDMSVSDIAAHLGISLAATYKRLERGVAVMQRHLQILG